MNDVHDISPWQDPDKVQYKSLPKLKSFNGRSTVSPRLEFLKWKQEKYSRHAEDPIIQYRPVQTKEILLKPFKVHQPPSPRVKAPSKPSLRKGLMNKNSVSVVQSRMSTSYSRRRVESIIKVKMLDKKHSQSTLKSGKGMKQERNYYRLQHVGTKIKEISFEGSKKSELEHLELLKVLEEKRRKMVVAVEEKKKKHVLDRVLDLSRLG